MDKNTHQYQVMCWDTLKKSINSNINKLNKSNLRIIAHELFQHNIIRGRGLLAHIIIQTQLASPLYTHVYGTLVSVINKNFPKIGELILKRLISTFRHTYQRNDKINCLSTIKFLAYLIDQNILHERILLQILIRLLENTTDDSVELAIKLINECRQQLSHVNPRELHLVFTTLRSLLNEASLEKHTKYMIKVLLTERKDRFETNSIIQPDLDVIHKYDQFTHIISLFDTCKPELNLSK